MKNMLVIFRILGVLLTVFSLSMLSPVIVALIYDEANTREFFISFAITLASGLALWLTTFRCKRELRTRDGFLVTAAFWIVLGSFGSLPFIFSDSIDLTISDAVFESMSGLTTTGATAITGLDVLPKSLLFYRQQLQWLGGIGIVVIAVAILPMLGVGGMQIYRAETPGPLKDSKLTPRITGTAKALFLIYLMLTVLCTAAYWFAGMSFFDAICHAFSTIAIGGFSTHDASIGYFDNTAIVVICCIGMLLSSVNYALHFYAWRLKRISHYFRDAETAFFVTILVVCIAITCLYLYASGFYGVEDSLLHGVFQAISIATTTGFTTTNFAAWPSFLPILLMVAAIMGGCAGSTAGGVKAVRVLLIMKQGIREMRQLVHPNAVIPLKVGNTRVPATVVSAVWSFFAVYIFTFITLVLLLSAFGMDMVTAYSAVVATISNLGPGLGDVAAHYGNAPDATKWIMCISMLLGRLEIFTLLVILTPTFWRS